MRALDMVFKVGIAQEVFGATFVRTLERAGVGVGAQVLSQASLAVEGLLTAIVGARNRFQFRGSRCARDVGGGHWLHIRVVFAV